MYVNKWYSENAGLNNKLDMGKGLRCRP